MDGGLPHITSPSASEGRTHVATLTSGMLYLLALLEHVLGVGGSLGVGGESTVHLLHHLHLGRVNANQHSSVVDVDLFDVASHFCQWALGRSALNLRPTSTASHWLRSLALTTVLLPYTIKWPFSLAWRCCCSDEGRALPRVLSERPPVLHSAPSGVLIREAGSSVPAVDASRKVDRR